MAADQEVDTQRDGGMKQMTSGDLLRGRRMPKTDCHGKVCCNKWIENGDDDDDDDARQS